MRRALPWLFAALAVIVAYFLIKSGGAKGSVNAAAGGKTKLQGSLDSISGLVQSGTKLFGTLASAFGSPPPPAANVDVIKAPASMQPFVPPPAGDYGIFPGEGSGNLSGNLFA